jgi:aspartyl protease family protein
MPRLLAFLLLVLAIAAAILAGLRHVPATDPPGIASQVDRTGAEARTEALITPLASSADGGRPHVARIPADRSGHYFVDARIKGQSVRFLVDTGATVVALSADDAQRIGLHTLPSDYTEEVRTAHGVARAAPATLPEIEVGSVRVRNVSAQVIAPDLDVSLLGMSFLGRLGQFSVEDGVLNLRE